ncbi:glycosyltransferase [Streptomyces sp. NPDC014894]|uniref:glycosyltransferase n=1 Tax=Streptomyces sp. NPDC014894 TaxID=3364931 RepID=UPI0036F95B77
MRGAPDHRTTAPGDLALLRSWCRDGTTVPPAELLAHAGVTPRADVLAGLLLPASAARQGLAETRRALAARLAEPRSPDAAASLLELAALVPSLPVDGERVLRTHGAAPERRLRHAAWRYAARCAPDRGLDGALWALGGAAGPGDLLTWAAAARERGLGRADMAAALPSDGPAAPPAPPPLPTPAGPGLTVVQTSLRGSLFHPGRGDSGGLSVFLTGLGTALAGHRAVRRVVTATLLSETEYAGGDGPRELAPGHFVVPLPDVDYGPWGTDPAAAPGTGPRGRTHPAAGWWFTHLMNAHRIRPDLVHVRFADDASCAISGPVAALGAKLVFTVTPDPHRGYFARRDRGESAPQDADDQHRVLLADALVERADAVVALPGPQSRADLARFFPRLTPGRGDRPVRMIREGIPALRPAPDDDRERAELVDLLFAPHPGAPSPGPPNAEHPPAGSPRAGAPRLDERAAGLPLLLNVGRLNHVKQQDVLVEAWLRSGAHHTCGLVLVGGGHGTSTAQEDEVLARIRALLAEAPSAEGRVALLPALSNRRVRLLESALDRLLPAPLPHLYICASAKEEFGIAVLEAMDAGMLAAGPLRGGVADYVTHGETGFLIDTSTAATMAGGITAVMGPRGQDRAHELRAVARAGQERVRADYGIARVRDAFAEHYTRTVAEPARPSRRAAHGAPVAPGHGPGG